MCFLRRGVVSTSPNPQSGGPPLVGCPRLLIQFIHSYPPYRRPFLHPQPEDAPFRGDREPHFLLTMFRNIRDRWVSVETSLGTLGLKNMLLLPEGDRIIAFGDIRSHVEWLSRVFFRGKVTDRVYKVLTAFNTVVNTLRTGSFKLFKRPFPGFLTILTL